MYFVVFQFLWMEGKKESFDHYYDIEKKTSLKEKITQDKSSYSFTYQSCFIYHIDSIILYKLFTLNNLIVDLFILSFQLRWKRREKRKDNRFTPFYSCILLRIKIFLFWVIIISHICTYFLGHKCMLSIKFLYQ